MTTSNSIRVNAAAGRALDESGGDAARKFFPQQAASVALLARDVEW